jgi:hypothetical protein
MTNLGVYPITGRGLKLLLVGEKIPQNTLSPPIGLDNGNFGPTQQQTINTTIPII